MMPDEKEGHSPTLFNKAPDEKMQKPLLKILLYGHPYEEKRNQLISRFVDDSLSSNPFNGSIGIDFKTKNIELDEKPFKLLIYRPCDSSQINSIIFYRGIQGLMLVYDITKRETFEHIRAQIEKIGKHAANNAAIANNLPVIMLVGTSSEAVNEREISVPEGQNLASEYGYPFFECSAINDFNITEAFMCLARKIIEQFGENPSALLHPGIELDDHQDRKSSKCSLG